MLASAGLHAVCPCGQVGENFTVWDRTGRRVFVKTLRLKRPESVVGGRRAPGDYGGVRPIRLSLHKVFGHGRSGQSPSRTLRVGGGISKAHSGERPTRLFTDETCSGRKKVTRWL